MLDKKKKNVKKILLFLLSFHPSTNLMLISENICDHAQCGQQNQCLLRHSILNIFQSTAALIKFNQNNETRRQNQCLFADYNIYGRVISFLFLFFFFFILNIRFRYRVESVLLSREQGDHPPREEVRKIIRFSFFRF